MRFSISVDVDAPVERVFAVMSDTDRWHEWTPSVTSIKRLDTGPFVVGSRAVIRQPKFPPALWQVTSIHPGRGFVWVSRAPGIRVLAHHFVEPRGEHARATLSLGFEGVLGPLFGRLTRTVNNRYLALEARGLKARSENPSFVHPKAES